LGVADEVILYNITIYLLNTPPGIINAKTVYTSIQAARPTALKRIYFLMWAAQVGLMPKEVSVMTPDMIRMTSTTLTMIEKTFTIGFAMRADTQTSDLLPEEQAHFPLLFTVSPAWQDALEDADVTKAVWGVVSEGPVYDVPGAVWVVELCWEAGLLLLVELFEPVCVDDEDGELEEPEGVVLAPEDGCAGLWEGLGEGFGEGDGFGEGLGEGDGDGFVGADPTLILTCFVGLPLLPAQLKVYVVLPVRLPVLCEPFVPTEPIVGLIEQLVAFCVDHESVVLLL
jgi:hypothetical protein